MKISHVNRLVRKHRDGTFRALKVGELIDESDIVVHDTYYDYPSESDIGDCVKPKDRIIRLTFNDPRL